MRAKEAIRGASQLGMREVGGYRLGHADSGVHREVQARGVVASETHKGQPLRVTRVRRAGDGLVSLSFPWVRSSATQP
jgi:hypothetical protein